MSEIDIPFSFRIDSAKRYHEFRNAYKDRDWIDLLEILESCNSYGLPEALVLISPDFYGALRASDPRGDRVFSPADKSSRCRSAEIWGYQCPFINEKIHIDHIFPQSKGGLTHPLNAMHLCREHNMSKFTDIHFLPWEKMLERKQWIELAFKHLIVAAQRMTSERLFIPSIQINRI